jgi:hypothetical protein
MQIAIMLIISPFSQTPSRKPNPTFGARAVVAPVERTLVEHMTMEAERSDQTDRIRIPKEYKRAVWNSGKGLVTENNGRVAVSDFNNLYIERSRISELAARIRDNHPDIVTWLEDVHDQLSGTDILAYSRSPQYQDEVVKKLLGYIYYALSDLLIFRGKDQEPVSKYFT